MNLTPSTIFKLGEDIVNRIYLGTTQIWPPFAYLPEDGSGYITAVEAADGQPLEDGVKNAMSALISELQATPGLWESIKIFAPFAGPRTLWGLAVPLKGNTGFTMTNATSADYDRMEGIRGGFKQYNISRVGFLPAPERDGRIKMGLLQTGIIPNLGAWAGALIGQEEDPITSTIISIVTQNNLQIMNVRTGRNQQAFLPLAAQTVPMFLMVERVDENNVFTAGHGIDFQQRDKLPFASPTPAAPAFAVYNAANANDGRVMTAFVGLSTGIPSGRALKTACLNYRTALIAALS